MKSRETTGARRTALVALGALAALVVMASPAAAKVQVHFSTLKGYDEPSTPAKYDKVGIVKTGNPKAKNILVLNPGTSAGGGYFNPIAKTIVQDRPKWQVWSVERRENLLEDQTELDKLKSGEATPQQFFNYYLGFLGDPSVTDHTTYVNNADVPFAKQWGMNTEVRDLRQVVLSARKHGRNVAMGGHSLGGTITTAYATWDFNGKAGADGLSGLVLIDGASSPTALTANDAQDRLDDLMQNSASPWLAFGGIGAPLAGLFGTVGSALAKVDPHGRSILGDWPLLPSYLKAPDGTIATNEAGYGYATDPGTSPSSLLAAQANTGTLNSFGSPRGWNGNGEITPIQRWASMFSGWGLQGHDGTAWYHPMRLTLDAGAVANGRANDAQDVLDVHSTMGKKLPKSLRIYGFGARLGGARIGEAADDLASQSGIPASHVTSLDRSATYAHNDPNSAAPKYNDFLKHLLPFLNKIQK